MRTGHLFSEPSRPEEGSTLLELGTIGLCFLLSFERVELLVGVLIGVRSFGADPAAVASQAAAFIGGLQEAGVAAAARTLGRAPSDYIVDSYRGLFVHHCEKLGAPVTDMLF